MILVWLLVVAPAPFCVGLLFSAGETQIWPEDLRVVAVLPGFVCLFSPWISFYDAKTFHNFCNLFNRFPLSGPSL